MKPNYDVIALHEENDTVTLVKVTRRGRELVQTLDDVIIDINNDAANYFCDKAKVIVVNNPDGHSFITTHSGSLDKLPRF